MGEPPSKDVCWQVVSTFATQGTLRDDPSVWHRLDWGGDVLTAPLATDRVVADPSLGQVPHVVSIGKCKAKISTFRSGLKTQIGAFIGHSEYGENRG